MQDSWMRFVDAHDTAVQLMGAVGRCVKSQKVCCGAMGGQVIAGGFARADFTKPGFSPEGFWRGFGLEDP